MQTSDIRFGENLNRVRTDKGITVERLADKSGVSVATIKSTIRSRNSTLPGLYNAYCLADAVGCSLDELCRGPGKHTATDVLAFLASLKTQIDEFFAA